MRGRGASVDVRIARTAEDLAAHHAVRRAVFVEEQGIFEDDDRDAWDDTAVKVVAVCGDRIVGAVRLYPLDEAGLWKGDRLAVLRDARRLHVGAPLVRFAVRTAGERGGGRMIAKIQARNVAFFQHLGWTSVGDPRDYRGASHQDMTIPLRPAEQEAGTIDLGWALGGAGA
jgi:putative N-acetyltransferase (TIGR04045 family)